MLHRFRLNIIVRVAILLILVAGVVLSFQKSFYLTSGFIGLLLVISVGNMIYYVNQTNRDLANFFTSVQYNDFTTTVSATHRGEGFGELYEGFNLINRKFQDIRAEKEANFQFLQTIVQHIEVGLLCTHGDGEVVLMNKALQTLLHKSYLLHLSNLQQLDVQLYQTIKNLKSGDRELIKLNVDNKLVQLSIQAIDLMLNREPFRLITFQNIQSELEAQELSAWQRLIRILTHEIMNSVAPIASLSATIEDVVSSNPNPDPEALSMVKNSLGVIRKRSEGLLDFTETYRSLTRIPPPKFQLVTGLDLLQEIYTLFRTEAQTRRIHLALHAPAAELTFQGDPGLLEQVLINLVKNAMDAVEGREDAAVDIYLQRGAGNKINIQVADNGAGIPETLLEQIFVPFFTTKANGSGIGLSLSRQIMSLHKGSIDVQSVEGKGTVVTLVI